MNRLSQTYSYKIKTDRPIPTKPETFSHSRRHSHKADRLGYNLLYCFRLRRFDESELSAFRCAVSLSKTTGRCHSAWRE